MKGMLQWLLAYLDDLLYLAGASLVIFATSRINVTAAFYVAGGFCLVAAVLVGLSRRMP